MQVGPPNLGPVHTPSVPRRLIPAATFWIHFLATGQSSKGAKGVLSHGLDLAAKCALHSNTRLLRLLSGQLRTAHLAPSHGGLAAHPAGGAAILVAAARTTCLAALGVHPLLGGPTLQVRASLGLADLAVGLTALSGGLCCTGRPLAVGRHHLVVTGILRHI